MFQRLLHRRLLPQWPLGWDISGTREQRLAQFRAARAALPRDFFAPFSLAAGTVPASDQECLAWPAPARTNRILPPGARYPNVPLLVVHGDMNTDHPIAGGARVAARYPNSRFVAIPQAGQSAAGWSDCAKRIIRSFVAELDPGDTHCAADEREVFPGVGAFPRRVRNYAPAVVDPWPGLVAPSLQQRGDARGIRCGRVVSELPRPDWEAHLHGAVEHDSRRVADRPAPRRAPGALSDGPATGSASR